MQDNLFKQFIEKLKKEKSPEEFQRFMDNLMNFSAAELYYAIMGYLNEEDFAAIEQISDDAKAEEEVIKRFKFRTGLAPQEFVSKLKEEMSQGYLSTP